MADAFAPFDIDAQNQAIARQRMLADALTQRGLQPPQGQMVSGRFVAPGWGSYAGQIANAVAGNVLSDKVTAAQLNLGQNYSKKLGEGLQTYLSQRVGSPASPDFKAAQPGQTLSAQQAGDLLNNDQNPGPLADPTAQVGTPAVVANPRAAVVGAMTSRIPELEKIGQLDFQNLLKQQQGEVKDINGQAVLTFTDGRPAVRIGDFRSPISVNSQLVSPAVADQTGKPRVLGDYRDKFGPVSPVAQPPYGPPIFGQTQPDTGEVKFAPGNSTFAPDSAALKDSLGQAGGVLKEARQELIDSVAAVNEGQRLMALAKDPSVISGFAADKILGLSSLATKLGLTGPDATMKTQALISTMAKRTLDASQKLGGPKSDRDILFLQDVVDGKLALTPQVIQEAAGLAIAAAHNQALNAVQQHSSAHTIPGVAERIAPLYPLPPFTLNAMNSDFEEIAPNSDRYRYKSKIVGGATQAGKGTAANPYTFEEYQQLQKGNR